MDAFYASVEQRDDPALRGRPVAVGGSRARGVVAAASYEARTFGVRSAMPSVTALRRCPDLVFVPPRFDVYREVSQQIRAIFGRFTELIEPLSLDEAYLDVTEDRAGLGSATAIANAIREAIRAETGLTASAGVSYNKFIAKLASDQNKPDGLCVIPPTHGATFVAGLPVKRFHGVGPVTARKMEALGILTGQDLRDRPLEFLQRHFGSYADYLYGAARGIDHRPVRAHRIAKSVGAERTFENDLSDRDALHAAMERVVDAAWTRIERSGVTGRTVTLKLRHSDFRTITRARSAGYGIADRAEFLAIGLDLLDQQLPVTLGVRLLGLTLSGLSAGADDEQASPSQAELPL
ncbi:DNA polymerase IV [Sphingomonas sanguinis]|uniref:DNA polymerase IV n=1 Tax=Sphingomonas sanguinis TaxID=33051 RepID=UPI001C56AC82|nr:DNA polymerase IV [Sphingomonas sanguinis]QXT36188.1 DNA polymerase IV [Sphingomonas sanguinis]